MLSSFAQLNPVRVDYARRIGGIVRFHRLFRMHNPIQHIATTSLRQKARLPSQELPSSKPSRFCYPPPWPARSAGRFGRAPRAAGNASGESRDVCLHAPSPTPARDVRAEERDAWAKKCPILAPRATRAVTCPESSPCWSSCWNEFSQMVLTTHGCI